MINRKKPVLGYDSASVNGIPMPRIGDSELQDEKKKAAFIPGLAKYLKDRLSPEQMVQLSEEINFNLDNPTRDVTAAMDTALNLDKTFEGFKSRFSHGANIKVV